MAYLLAHHLILESHFLKKILDHLLLQEIRNYISNNFDSSYLTKEPRVYKSKVKNSQEAHEAIRPTDISKNPKDAKLSGDEEKLYTLIWNRTVASQMESARYERKTLIIKSQNNEIEFRGFI
jgi:DNA topoisomerase-1